MLIIEGNIVNIDGTRRGRIEIGDDGIIRKIGEPTGSADIILDGELIFPGFIDVHVHARESVDHTQDYKEDFTTAGEAAINGGVVAFADMPNNPIAPVDDKSYAEKYQLTKKCAADIVLYAGIGPSTKSFECSAPIYRQLSDTHKLVPGLARDGHATRRVPYKAYMGKSVGDLFFEGFDDLDKVLANYEGQAVSFHCEDPKILAASQSAYLHELTRPPRAEISAVDFALQMIEKHSLQGKICHCSTVEAFAKISAAKERNLNVTVEVTPHHLYFDESMMDDGNRKMFQVNPPIHQSAANRLALIAALKKGEIDYLATDHAPHTIAEKEKGVSGLPHLDTYGPFATWLMKECEFTPEEIARVCSCNPGRFLNQFSNLKYGKIEEGYAGSLTVLDMNRPVKIEKSMLKTKCGWSPFEGVVFPGSVVMTIIKGRVFKV